MTRAELENELKAYHWGKRYHGTHCDTWQSGELIITLKDKGVGGLAGEGIIPYSMITVKDGKLIVHTEVSL